MPRPALRTTKDQPHCPYCDSLHIAKRGTRKKKLEIVQLWRCSSCKRTWTPTAPDAQHKTFTPRVVKDALLAYGLGYTLEETKRKITERRGAKFAPSVTTIARYLKEYTGLLTVSRIRDEILKTPPFGSRRATDRYRPTNIIKRQKLYHRQVYEYAYHRAKLDRLRRDPEHAHLRALIPFLENMHQLCPHELFSLSAEQGASRASQLKAPIFNPRTIRITPKQNAATTLANFVIPTIGDNKARHSELQRFFLACDSSTIAVEIPIWLDEPAIAALEREHSQGLIPRSYDPLTNTPLPRTLTGHIDFLQVRNGALHILDYKPDAETNKPTAQLTLYSLALTYLISEQAKIHGLPTLKLFDIKCAWFNEATYNEFFPRTVVANPRI